MATTLNPLPPFYNMNYTTKDGYLSDEALRFNDNVYQTLNALVGQVNTGFILPSATTLQITALLPTAAVGTIWLNTDSGFLQYVSAANTLLTVTAA